MKQQSGFTLIETLVYLGLFSIIIVGVVAVAYATFEGNGRLQTKDIVQEEGDFLLAKINRALGSAKSVTISGTTLDITKWDSTHAIFSLSGTTLQLGGVNLNNSNTQITGLNFVNNGHGTPVEDVIASFTLQTKTPNGQTYSENFTTTKYLRK